MIGLKHHISGDPGVTKHLLGDGSIAKIVLRRDNLLACYSSALLLRAKQQANAHAKADTFSRTTVEFIPRRFDRFLEMRGEIDAAWNAEIDRCSGPRATIEYNEARTDDGVARLLRFLGVDPNVPEQRTKKRNPDDIVGRFSNPAAVLRFLRERSLEHWSNEAAVG